MKLRKHLALLLSFVFCLAINAKAADKLKIHGTVLDPLGDPVIGASVIIKGTGNGTSTNVDGNFTLDAAVGDTLQVSYVGYVTEKCLSHQRNPILLLCRRPRSLWMK